MNSFDQDDDYEDNLDHNNNNNKDNRSTTNDFEEICRIGSGSFGTVMKVKRILDNKIYVIKTVKISELSKKEQYEAINEVDLLAKMDSNYVVKYYDSFIDHGSLKIVMEFCNKGDLQKMIKRAQKKELKSLGEYTTWHIILQILLGLHYLHNMKVLHRDMKSANVFLMKDPNQDFYCVKIGDLGVAKVLDSSTAFARSLVGTPYYLSPELCADMPYRDKSDVWAFGVILYECCMLSHPFDARNQCALIMKIVQAQMAPIASHVPTPLCDFIHWILQKDPKDRPKIKDILNDRYIRQKLEEHEFEVPTDLINYQLSDRIGLSNSSMISPEKMSVTIKGNTGIASNDLVGNNNNNNNNNDDETIKISQNNFVNTNDKTKISAPNQPRKIIPKSADTTKKSNEIRGTRVRGNRAESKISSQKARERHQVKSSPSMTKNINNVIDIESESKHDNTLVTNNIRRGSKQEFNWDEAKRLLDDIAEKEQKDTISHNELNDENIENNNNDYEDEDDDEEDYENDNDFEDNVELINQQELQQDINELSLLDGEAIIDTTVRPMSARRNSASSMSISGNNQNYNEFKQSDNWKIESVHTPDEKNSGNVHKSDYKSELRKSIAKQLDANFLSSLEELTQLSTDEKIIRDGNDDYTDNDDNDNDEGTVDPELLHENSELWKSLWSQGRGILNTDRHINSDEFESSNQDDNDLTNKTDSEQKNNDKPVSNYSEAKTLSKGRKIKLLEGLVEDARGRSQNKLGEVVFQRVYDLLSEMMYAPVAKSDEAEDSGIIDRTELHELEKTLSDRFNGAKELMCEVVFDIKKLLAIESSLDRLKESNHK